MEGRPAGASLVPPPAGDVEAALDECEGLARPGDECVAIDHYQPDASLRLTPRFPESQIHRSAAQPLELILREGGRYAGCSCVLTLAANPMTLATFMAKLS